MSELDVWMNGSHVGVWRKIRGYRDQFVYREDWLRDPQFRPLSLSLPITASREITSPLVGYYFDNLLPDNSQIRERLRKRFQVRSTESFDLLQAIGRDCVGAVQLMPPGKPPVGWDRIRSTPLKTDDVEAILRAVPTAAGPLSDQSDENEDFRISIAGAQEKTALLRIGNNWHRPIGATPTTHILKLPLGIVGGGLQLDLSDSVDNEWLCANLFEVMHLPVARTQIATFGDQRVLVVERFDRHWRNVGTRDPTAARFQAPPNAWIARLPQEDFCQATGQPPEAKYEKDGGPGWAQVLRILNRGAAPERDSNLFALSQLMFWLLAATDGHAKNFSIFLRRDGYELTPFYDLLSAWPVIGKKARQLQPQKVKMAMATRTGNRPHYRWNEIQARHFKGLAESLPDPKLWSIMLDTARSVPGAIASLSKRLPPDLKESVWTSVTEGVARKAEQFLRDGENLRD